jgi:predicted MFS family arabinose efflux permease
MATSPSGVGIGGVLGRLCSGALMDRLGHFPTLLAIFALQVASFVLFACATRLPLLWFAAALFGFAYGGGVTALAPLCSALYGRAHVASIVGAIFALTALPSAAGPWIAGWLYDATGGYAPALGFAAGLNVAALVLTLVLSRRAHYR